jgi:DNA-binding NarL/FixJ family response regulator
VRNGDQGGAAGAPGALRVLVVDDHTVFRTGLRTMLADEGFAVSEARSGEDAVLAASAAPPDAILMDFEMPGISGAEATRRLKAASSSTPVVMLATSERAQDVVDAVLAGASGYVLKDASIDEVAGAVRAAAGGGAWVTPRVAPIVLERMREAIRREPPAESRRDLTERERQILRLIAEGKDNAQIARELYVSAATVKNQVSRLLAKLQIDNRIQAAVYAVRQGLV